MLEELRQVIGRMLLTEDDSENPEITLFCLQTMYQHFLGLLLRISKTESLQIQRIFIEELLETLDEIPLSYCLKGEHPRQQRKIWRYYILGINQGATYDKHYERYLSSKEKLEAILTNPYSESCKSFDFKAQRYEYALSKYPVPKWIDSPMVANQLEEIINSYLLAWFSARDWYLENINMKKGA